MFQVSGTEPRNFRNLRAFRPQSIWLSGETTNNPEDTPYDSERNVGKSRR